MSRPTRLLAVLLLAGIVGCSESALRIRLIFPDAASVELASTVLLYALKPEAGVACNTVMGQTPDSFPDQLLTRTTINLGRGNAASFPDLPMRSMVISALIYDESNEHFLSGCEPVEVSPGDDKELLIYLDCAPGRSPCLDRDGDGVGRDQDCDDLDPCRSPKLVEAATLCGANSALFDSEWFVACRARLLLAGQPFSPPFCDDGVDQDCDGKDVACRVDNDCDDYSPPQDCDDNDPNISPQAPEICDGKDNNCNGVVDEGCAACDVDGDGHADINHTGPGCSLPNDDPDDFDAGIHPETTSSDSGKEGGTLLGALRGYCSSSTEKNGKLRHRDVDHDGDKLPASADGCPSESCDGDGDGYEGPQCSPPKSEEDCNDNDPQIFPGAPDLCGDGVAQNCVADQACCADPDGDKYCPPEDCNDNRADVHPWAAEKCDSVDNDCDKLRDEGNPDNQGQPIPTDRKLCTDDNDGKCAPSCTAGLNCHSSGIELTGVCACSAIDTSMLSIHDPNGARVKCSGEDLSLPGSPRCFGAVQPTTEKCDNLDWSCDGVSIDPADVFVEKGRSCGTDVGACTLGVVVGCDLSKTIDSKVLSVFAALKIDFSPHWVCTSSTKLPAPEQCNGRDDDCDTYTSVHDVVGADPGWPELDEKDGDSDGYLPCLGCTTQLPSPLKGCGDCLDTDKSIYPGAYEACDGVDNNCKSGDEGDDECGSLTCCASQKACKNLQIDKNNCGNCSNVCPAAVTDRCTGGNCVCGNTGGVCTGDRNCDSGSCICKQGGLCQGCCSSNNCLPGNTTAACGDGGEPCQQCTTSNPCKTAVCNAVGDCATANVSDGTGCPGGVCHGGTCCTGCWDGNICRAGTTTAYCGDEGLSCQSCPTPGECETASCSNGTCSTNNKSDGTVCSAGMCRAGGCCDGCWDGMSCLAGLSNTLCGVGGVWCENCSAQSMVCSSGVCT